MKVFADFFIIIVFVGVYVAYDQLLTGLLALGWVDPAFVAEHADGAIYAATAVAIVASALQVSVLWLWRRRVERMHLITLGTLVVLGGATLALHDPIFVKWKPTVVYWLFAAAFLGSHFIGQRPLVQRALDAQMSLPEAVWRRLNASWVAFFISLGVANIYIAYSFNTDVWMAFKVGGGIGLTLVFVIIQAVYLARHIKPETESENES